MGSEECPLCGKTFKRLKTHLPHCKAAKRHKPLKAPNTQVSGAPSKSTKEKKVKQVKEGKKLVSPFELQASQNPSSPLSSAKGKGKQKLADETKKNTSPVLSSAQSKPKKSLRALIEAAKAEHFAKESSQGPKSTTKNEITSQQTSHPINNKSHANSVESTSYKHLSEENNLKDSDKFHNVMNILSKTKGTNFLNCKAEKSHAKGHDGDGLRLEAAAASLNRPCLKTKSGLDLKSTLQDVRATSGRHDQHRHSGRQNTTSPLWISPDIERSSVALKTQEQGAAKTTRLLGSGRSSSELQVFLETPGAQPPGPTPTAAQQTKLASSVVSVKEGLNVSHHTANVPLRRSPPVCQSPSSARSPAVTQTTAEGLHFRSPNVEKNPNEGTLTRRHLGQVRLKELPDWLASKMPHHPRDAAEMVQKGWQWYYRRYIDVKKGGVAGLGMLLAGYCVLSYIWTYPHMKATRWRKYH